MLTLLYSCEDADVNDPIGSDVAPEQIEVTEIRNNFGKTTIIYNRPNDENLKYVKAIYEPRNGTIREVNASYFMDSLVLDGFAEQKDYEVKLYSVSAGEAVSDPVTVTASPLEPPYLSISKSVRMKSTFGGINVKLDNPTKAKIAIGILKGVNPNELSEISMSYSELDKLDFSVRGQEPTEAFFGLFIRDRWGQISDTLKLALTPIEEVMCDKTGFVNLKMPGDTYECHTWGGTSVYNKLERVWNERLNETTPVFHTKPNDPMPQHFSIDLGVKYQLSRMEVYPRGSSTDTRYVWDSGWPKTVQIWGSNDPQPSTLDPNEDADYWNSWELVGEYDIVRPSGETEPGSIVPLTDDDKRTLTAGYEIELPEGTEYQYIRFRTLENWSGSNWIMLSELSFYGTESK